MRILVVGVHFFSSFAWSIKRALERLGHQVDAFDYRKNPFTRVPLIRTLYYRTIMQTHLLRAAARARPDFIVIGKGELIKASTIEQLHQKQRVPIVNWFPDPRLYAHEDVMRAIPFFSYVFTKNQDAVQQARLLNLPNVRYLDHCADPELHLSVESDPNPLYQADVSLVGTCYPYRDLIASQLTDFNLKLWGRGWSGSVVARKKPQAVMQREARGLEQARVFQHSAVNLNTHTPDDTLGVNQRVFDICGSGGFQLVDHKDRMGELFTIGEEIETFRSMAELRGKVRYYLDHRDQARRIGGKAREKAAAAHTYDHRMREVLELVFGRRNT